MPEQQSVEQPGGRRRPRLRPAPILTESACGTPPKAPELGDLVTITIDGRPVQAREGEWIIKAAEEAGVYIPRFCYHPRMKPVGMCRMCLVEVSGPRGFSLQPACYNPVAEGMEIRTESEAARKAQDGVLEFLLINHPLDCPVCDKGGECPLQDQTLGYGPGETRFVEEKRHWDKPTPISELVYLDRERCIQCARCVRFADEVAGDPLIDFYARGDRTEVAIFKDHPYTSYFSGNIVQICPVGALTAKPYRFRARPWDLEQVETTCTACSIGCRVAAQSSADELVRHIGVDSDPVNWGWLCDKGRFGFQASSSPERLSVPMVRRNGELVEASWAEALDAAAEGLKEALHTGGPESLAVIGGARLPNEDAYAWAKAARVALGTDNVDCQLGDGLPAEVVLGLPRATIDQAAAAPLVVTLCGDLKEELPILYLRLRHAVREKGVQLLEISPAATGMSRYAALSLRYRPGEVAALVAEVVGSGEVGAGVAGVQAEEIEEARAHLARAWEKGGPGAPSVVVVLGRPSLAEAADGLAEAASMLAGLPGVAFLPALRRANVHGALDLGLAPGLLPGRVSLEAGRQWYEHHWSAVLPERPGLTTEGVLAQAARGRIGAIVLLGSDPRTDFPDNALAVKALAQTRFVVAVDTFLTESSRRADVVLPAAGYAERRGTFTNLEGRITWLAQKVTAPAAAWPDWVVACELASRLGADLGFSSLEEIWEEVERVSPLHAGAGYEALGSVEGRDGLVVPLASPPPPPRWLDPMADPGIASAEVHSTPPTSLMVAGAGVNRLRRLAGADDKAQAPGGGAEAQQGLACPPMIDPPAAAPRLSRAAPSAGADDGSLRLVAPRRLWDAGTIVQHCPALAGLHEPLRVSLNPGELERLGVADGERVRVSSSRGSVTLAAGGDPGVSSGTAVIPFNLPGRGAGELIDASAPLTAVRLSALEDE